MIEKSEDYWQRAIDQNFVDIWTEYLDRVDISDHFSFLEKLKVLSARGKIAPIHEWLNELGSLELSDLQERILDGNLPIRDRLTVATFVRWTDRLRHILRNSADESLPNKGILQYFSDDLATCVLVGYRRPGSTVELESFLAFPDPSIFLDPLSALAHARTDQELELLRQSLLNRHKIVIHRNVLTRIDRESEADVFGPSIDTLVLNEWLFKNRYFDERTIENAIYFEELIPFEAAQKSELLGSTFLEIGSGNGLLTATFARNESKIKRISAIDSSISAIVATYRNSSRQRRLPRGGAIGDRGRYIVARYEASAVPQKNDLVVCNPPYIPLPPGPPSIRSQHPLARATLGTDLLKAVIRDASLLLNPNGKLVMVISEMAEEVLKGSVPDGFSAKVVDTRRVVFDVGPVRGDKALLKWLKSQGKLSQSSGGRHSYSHNIKVYVVESNTEKMDHES